MPAATPRPFLLDSSAVLTLIEDEAGASRVEEVLRQEECFLPWMALLEVRYISRKEVGEEEAARRFALMKQLGCSLLWKIDEHLVLTASEWKAGHRISLADALIAAYARHAGAILLHKDPEFEALAGSLPMERLPYKTKLGGKKKP